ncbi:MAG TPA: peptidylprolyl isomerase [Aggregatilineales bacterium]|nr:peptidylprolyl isomerase [Anaerolineales bacterium]HRE46759.1 peptidylprolyl isomerase [Aggregatilineales bacterium]
MNLTLYRIAASALTVRFLTRAVIGVGMFLLAVSIVGYPRLAAAQGTPDPVAATVNGQAILMSTLDHETNRRLEGLSFAGEAPPLDLPAFRAIVLETLIQQVLIEQAAAIQQITVTEAEVDAEIAVMVGIAGNRENWLAQLAADRLSEDDFRGVLRSALITQKMRDVVTANTCLAVEQVRARHILVLEESVAKALYDQLMKGGDFVALARQFSLDVTTRDVGGDLGWFARGQLLQPIVEDTAFTQPMNTFSAPVKSELGYHIIQTLERASDRPIDQETCFRLSETAFEAWLQALVTKAQIERFI